MEGSAWGDPIVVVTLALVGATLFLGIVAAFQDRIRSWLWKPDLRLTVSNRPPQANKTLIGPFGPSTRELKTPDWYAYYLRLLVTNEGRARATDVQIYVDQVEKRRADGAYELVTRFLPMNLKWSHVGTPFVSIPPGGKRHCDLAHVVDPQHRDMFAMEDDPSRAELVSGQTLLSLDLEVQPYARTHLLEPGAYHLTLQMSSAETQPRRYVVEVNHTGQWYDDEAKMLRDGLGLKLVSERVGRS